MSWLARIDQARLALAADIAAVLVAISLPWSTSATGILLVVWLVLLLPTLDTVSARDMLRQPAAVLPVLLWALAVLALLWGDVSWKERIAGLGGYNKLLVIPLLLLQFQRSTRGHWVLIGFTASATVLIAVSWLFVTFPTLQRPGKDLGIPVKDYISQSAICTIAAFGLLACALEAWRRERRALAAGLVLLAAGFVGNIIYVVTGRTALVVLPILGIMLASRAFGWKGLVGALVLGSVLAGLAWTTSPYLRARVLTGITEVQSYQREGAFTSAGLRLEYWKKSVGFIAEAPVIGHGTGTMPDRFRRVATSGTGASSDPTVNPHNQYLAVWIELGTLGLLVLAGMWIAHLMLFRGGTMAAWVGLIVVTQNIISSAFNSHLFDFTHGWLYVVGVGVAGGMVLRQPSKPPVA